MKTYAIREMFLTIQGEGHHAGSRAVFVRTSGCNVWSGREEDRRRDRARGVCAEWCDTEFRGTDGPGGGRFAAPEIAGRVLDLWAFASSPLVVITGGEPSITIDAELVDALHQIGARVHVETNGSRPLPKSVDWVTLSPKPPMPVFNQRYDEVKVVYPAVDPLRYEGCAAVRFVQPLDHGDRASHVDQCKVFVLGHPGWRLSLQTHKLIGVP